MAKKTTISRDNVFRNTRATPVPVQGKSVEKAPHQTAVWLGDEEIEWLDGQCQAIRREGKRDITRSALIRALIRSEMQRPMAEKFWQGVTKESQEDDLVRKLLR